MTAFWSLFRLYWPLALIQIGWILGLSACGAGFGWSVAKTVCGLEP